MVSKRKEKCNNKEITQPRAGGEKAVHRQAQEKVRWEFNCTVTISLGQADRRLLPDNEF